jgi:hypothetical protein
VFLVLAGKVYNYGFNLSPSLWTWGSSPKSNGFRKFGEEMIGTGVGGGSVVCSDSHCSTVERLFAWEKKLCEEVKVKIFISTPSCRISLLGTILCSPFTKQLTKKRKEKEGPVLPLWACDGIFSLHKVTSTENKMNIL